MNTQTEKEIEKFLSQIQFDDGYLSDYIDADDYNEIDFENAFNSIMDILESNNTFYNIDDADIIYSGNAMEFLDKYDTTLEKSLKLANNIGYSLENLNSEILASILKSDILKKNLRENRQYINNFFFNLIEEEEEDNDDETDK